MKEQKQEEEGQEEEKEEEEEQKEQEEGGKLNITHCSTHLLSTVAFLAFDFCRP